MFYTVLYGLTTMCSTIASGIYSPAIHSISEELGVSLDVAQLGTGLFVLGERIIRFPARCLPT